MRGRIAGLAALALAISQIGGAPPAAGEPAFNFSRYLFGEPATLSVMVVEKNEATGYALLNGVDTRPVTGPFTWNWGDGVVEPGWFPMTHTYEDVSRSYVCTVMASYVGGGTDSAQTVVRFAPPSINPVPLPEETAVTIPGTVVELTSRMPGYGIPGDLQPFGDEFFTDVPRPTVEYVLSAAAAIQKDMVNGDVFLVDGGFRQVVLRDSDFGGMYSLWYTSPVSFAAGDWGFQGSIGWSSFLHEMGHNLTLNFPAGYYYGGKIDGCANAIYSETMAQIYQHATAYDLVNQGAAYGLSPDLVLDIRQNAIQTIQGVRNAYERYISTGMNFSSWNEPGSSDDETFDTFMTVAYKFCEHAENAGEGYREPAKRMMWLLAAFDGEMRDRYDQWNNTAEADTFRATLMVAAQSFAFGTDLRDEFRGLNFPVSDATYEELMGRVTGVDTGPGGRITRRIQLACAPNPFRSGTTVAFNLPKAARVSVRVYDTQGRLVRVLADGYEPAGSHRRGWNGADMRGRMLSSGVYVVRVEAEDQVAHAKVVLAR
ncbi:MAG: T9SS type A sorting domain-containing protein [Candidatus Eisenbacteria bacterium]|nr:T9SS type A sorting domain-containing protein [Candidatus Eisenbacteria bacterium]